MPEEKTTRDLLGARGQVPPISRVLPMQAIDLLLTVTRTQNASEAHTILMEERDLKSPVNLSLIIPGLMRQERAELPELSVREPGSRS